MKITVGQLKQLIQEQVDTRLMHPLAKGLQVKFVSKEIDDDPDSEYFGEVASKNYIILDASGNKVGELSTAELFGSTSGSLYGRPLPDLEGYQIRNSLAPGAPYKNSGPVGKLHKFAKSKTGWKWFEVTAKQMNKNKSI